MPVKEVAVNGQIVRIKGRVKAITVPKEKTRKILKRTELKILDKKYEALLPPLDDMEHNTIDVQGLASLVQQYYSLCFKELQTLNRRRRILKWSYILIPAILFS